jgi:quinol monooxygenase YgiN
MSSISIKMQAIPARRRELLQTLNDLASLKRQEEGFLDSRIHIDVDDVNRVTLVEDWVSQIALHAHMESEIFHILRGALKVLTARTEISFKPGESYESSSEVLGREELLQRIVHE